MKQIIKKTNLLVALLATTLFSTVAAAAVPQTALIEAEPVNQTNLTNTAHNSLKLSLAPIKAIYMQQLANNGLAKKKQETNQNKLVALTKTSLIAE